MEIVKDEQTWNSSLLHLGNAHILQTWQWGQIKAAYGWQPTYYLWRAENGEVTAAALVLERMQPERACQRRRAYPGRSGGRFNAAGYLPAGGVFRQRGSELR